MFGLNDGLPATCPRNPDFCRQIELDLVTIGGGSVQLRAGRGVK